MVTFIAQAGSGHGQGSGGSTSSVVLWVVVLIALIMVGGLAVMWMRRRLFAPEQSSNQEGLMESMRRLRDSGQMTQEEFDAFRRSMAARYSSKPTAGATPATPATPQKRVPPGSRSR